MDAQKNLDQELSDLVNNFVVPESVKNTIQENKIVLLVGVSGAGKNTIIKQLLKTDDYYFMVSTTTRDPRTDNGVTEQEGVAYYFVDRDEMKDLIRDDQLIEVEIHHRSYVSGSTVGEIQKAVDQGKIPTSDIGVGGIEYYKSISPDVKAIFILPPSYEEWVNRLGSRYGDPKDHMHEINERMKTASSEIERALNDGYFEFVVNDDSNEVTKLIQNIANGEVDQAGHERGQTVAKELLDRLKQM